MIAWDRGGWRAERARVDACVMTLWELTVQDSPNHPNKRCRLGLAAGFCAILIAAGVHAPALAAQGAAVAAVSPKPETPAPPPSAAHAATPVQPPNGRK